MFIRSNGLRFAADDTPDSLVEAFAALADVIAGVSTTDDVETVAEAFWAALHGMVVLRSTERLRSGFDGDRIRALVHRFGGVYGNDDAAV